MRKLLCRIRRAETPRGGSCHVPTSASLGNVFGEPKTLTGPWPDDSAGDNYPRYCEPICFGRRKGGVKPLGHKPVSPETCESYSVAIGLSRIILPTYADHPPLPAELPPV